MIPRFRACREAPNCLHRAFPDLTPTAWGRRRGEADLEFVLSHVDDVDLAWTWASPGSRRSRPAELTAELTAEQLGVTP